MDEEESIRSSKERGNDRGTGMWNRARRTRKRRRCRRRSSCWRSARGTGARDCRAKRSDRGSAGRRADAGPRAARRRAGHRQDADREIGRPAARPRLPARAGHARPDARRHSGHHHFPAGLRCLHLPRRAGLYRSAAGGRNQPHAAAHPGRAAGVHGRAPGDERRRARVRCPRGSPSSPRRTRSTSRAPIRCPRRSSTAFC